MNQEQPQRHRPDQSTVAEPIKYGDVFNVTGELAYRPVAPRHAATAQAAENLVLGENMRGGPAAVSRQLDTTRALALLVTATPLKSPERKASPLLMKQLIPMATALSLKKLLDGLWHNMWSHRCQLHLQEKRLIEMQLQLAAEMRATGRNEIAPGGVAAVAQYAASVNLRDVNKTKLGDVLKDATQKLPADKPVTREDARAVIGAEIRNSPNMATTPGGGAESLAAAARLTRSGNKRMKTISLCTYMHAC
ncbi:hypothetical protein FF1_007969 [Malus domestica]|uniref:SMP domain-containing protein n=1 Tax=Malus domestica TaxID=3750 RepID=A0A498ILF7_MALDO|nr:hypothetical protein DVH24_027075 [Malus domestica]